MSLIWTLGRQQTFLKRWSSLQMDASVSHRIVSPRTITCHCFFLVLVLMQILLRGVGISDLGKTACTGSSSMSLCASSTIPRVSYLFRKDTLQGKEGFLLLLCAIIFFYPFLSLVMLPSSLHKTVPGPASVVVTLNWLACIRDGKVRLNWSVSLSNSQDSSVCPPAPAARHQTEQFTYLAKPSTGFLATTVHL